MIKDLILQSCFEYDFVKSDIASLQISIIFLIKKNYIIYNTKLQSHTLL